METGWRQYSRPEPSRDPAAMPHASTTSDPCFAQHCLAIDAVLERHRPLWQENPFRDPLPAWLSQRPQLAQRALALDEAELAVLEQDAAALTRWLAPDVEGLATTLAGAEPALPTRPAVQASAFAAVHVPGRKWEQISRFLAALPARDAAVVEWCAGKGHLGRTLARLQQRPVRCLERQPELCAAGSALAATLPVSFECCDVLTGQPHLPPAVTVVALHACGALHERLLNRCVEENVAELLLAPCCYHLTDRWRARARDLPDPGFDVDTLHLAVQDLVTAPARVRRARLRERSFRAGFDSLQRWLRGVDAYLPQPSLRGPQRQLDFPGFCQLMAATTGLTLPAGIDYDHWLDCGRQRDANSRRLELPRQGFRRLLELRVVYDRALYLQQAGFEVKVSRFCHPELTPRNLLLHARR